MVNMKLRTLKNNNVRNSQQILTTSTRQSEQVLEMFSVGVHGGTQHRAQQQKRFVKIKPVPVVKHMEISQFFFAKVV